MSAREMLDAFLGLKKGTGMWLSWPSVGFGTLLRTFDWLTDMAMDFSPRVGFHCRLSEGVCTACVQLPAVTSVCSLKTEALAALPLFGDTETTHTKSTLKDKCSCPCGRGIEYCHMYCSSQRQRKKEKKKKKKDMLLPLKEGCRGERKQEQKHKVV